MGTISEGPRAHLNNERFLTNDPLIIYYIFLGIVYSFLKVVKNEKKIVIISPPESAHTVEWIEF